MSGTPTEAEIQAQWAAAVDILETTRAFVDGTLAVASGKWDTLEKALEGDYLPVELAAWANNNRAACSDLISPGRAAAALTPILFEYMARIDSDATGTQGFGSGKRTVAEMFRALYDWFIEKSYTVESRAISYAASPTATGASNVGNGTISRLTVDENGQDLEAVTVEKKRFRCIADQTSGVNEHAEVFEVIGEAASFDAVLRASFGSGSGANTTIVSKNAGSGNGGSLLTNSSFSTFDSTTGLFTGWTETAVPVGSVDQDIVNVYRSHPGAQLDASLELTGGLGTITLTQTLTAMRVRRLDPDRPYQLRVMLNADIGTVANGGSVTIRCGSVSASVTIADLVTNGWVELALPFTASCWFRTFNEADFAVEIEWSSSTSGTVLVDDVIFAPLDLIDGTYWFLRQNNATPVSWLIDDVFTFVDTGGAPATGKIQWWLWVAGLGYLPSSGTPTFADP